MTLPVLDSTDFDATRAAAHGYARVLGAWLKTCRVRRKHWWHASLRPSLVGLTTGAVHSGGFELELDLRHSVLYGRARTGDALERSLVGQAAAELATDLEAFLRRNGVPGELVPTIEHDTAAHPGYRSACASELVDALCFVAATLEDFRAGIREETSPIQLWPHHFDLSMLWLPGDLIPDEDPADAELSDRQMNFGFAFGDAGIPEPYFYITAYPTPAALSELHWPAGASWHRDSFEGIVLPYGTLARAVAPRAELLALWNHALAAGRELLAAPDGA